MNLWPRPVQTPHPPLLIPGAASSSTWDYCHDRDLPYAYLSYFGGRSAENVLDRFWERAAMRDKDANPYRAAMLQLVGVAETDAQAEERFSAHLEHFYHKLCTCPRTTSPPPAIRTTRAWSTSSAPECSSTWTTRWTSSRSLRET